MTPRVDASEVGYSAGRVRLLDDVTLVVESGQLVGIVGPNGAGKSTMLGILAGDLRPDRGRVALDGIDIGKADERTVAALRSVLPQHRVADIPFTAAEVVEMGRYPRRRDPGNSAARDRAAVAAAMESTDTSGFADRIYATLSGGEQARVSMARILAQNAPLLLLDEPTAALDVAHEERVMQELTRQTEAGAAVVAVLHDLNTAARYTTKIIAMADGRIAAAGSPAEVLTDDLLGEIYAQPMRVVPHPFRDSPLVLVDDRPEPPDS